LARGEIVWSTELMAQRFATFANRAATFTGNYLTFLGAVLVIVLWALTGPLFGFSETWQLVINTGTTIVTFLMVFLIQNTQNRDAHAVHMKLDELIKALANANNDLIRAEDETDEELAELKKTYGKLSVEHAEIESKLEDDRDVKISPS
jgi:low affinity Fe/Cu permease